MAVPPTMTSLGIESSADAPQARNSDKGTIRLVILCPVLDDWTSFEHLARDIGEAIAETGCSVRLIAVDDGSAARPRAFNPEEYRGLDAVEILRLMTNLGHQRAIAAGLAELCADDAFDAVVVMDADGEDRPADLRRLLDLHRRHTDKVLLVSRSKRSESLPFRVLYVFYKALFWLATGTRIRHGNFSLVPRAALAPILASSGAWNHFAGSILRARVPKIELCLPRGNRYAGKSKMNLVSLVVHGLSAISVYADVVMVRVVVISLFMALLSFIGLGAVVAVRYATDLAIPGWATNAAGLALIVLLQTAALSLMASFILLSLRSQPTFLPLLDARRYILSREQLFRRAE